MTRAYEDFVDTGSFVFRRADGGMARVGDAVTFRWEMVPPGGGEVAGGGREFLVLDPDGLIRRDYQSIEP